MATAKKFKQEEVLSASVNQAAALARVNDIEKEIVTLVQHVGSDVALQDDEDYRVACDLLIGVVVKRKWVEEQKDGFMEDVRRLVARVDGWFAKPLERLDAAEAAFRKAVQDYALTLEARAQGLRAAAAHLPARDEKKALSMLDEANGAHPPKVAGISLTTKVKVEIIAEKNIPDQYWKRVVDVKAVEAAIERGENVPGARAVVTKSVRVTPKHAKGEE